MVQHVIKCVVCGVWYCAIVPYIVVRPPIHPSIHRAGGRAVGFLVALRGKTLNRGGKRLDLTRRAGPAYLTMAQWVLRLVSKSTWGPRGVRTNAAVIWNGNLVCQCFGRSTSASSPGDFCAGTIAAVHADKAGRQDPWRSWSKGLVSRTATPHCSLAPCSLLPAPCFLLPSERKRKRTMNGERMVQELPCTIVQYHTGSPISLTF